MYMKTHHKTNNKMINCKTQQWKFETQHMDIVKIVEVTINGGDLGCSLI